MFTGFNSDMEVKLASQKSKIILFDKVQKTVISKQCDRKMPALPCDSVELSPEAKILMQANRIFSRSKKFTIDDYNSLSKLEKAVLRQASKSSSAVAEDSLQVGLKVKEHLDKRYGNDGYVFCSIGTSPSGIARVLEFSGVETKYLPISRLNWLESTSAWKNHTDKFSGYEKFLAEQGLSPEVVSNSDKEYLFYDYVQQGMSLIVFEKMMKEHFGLDLPNVDFHNMNYLCYSSCAKKIDPPQYSLDYVRKYMGDSKIAEYCGVPHLDIKEIDKIEECKNFESVKSKMFNFSIIDNLAKKGLLKENPNNKNSL